MQRDELPHINATIALEIDDAAIASAASQIFRTTPAARLGMVIDQSDPRVAAALRGLRARLPSPQRRAT
jgi:hypothetical protein